MRTKHFRIWSIALSLLALGGFTACDEDEVAGLEAQVIEGADDEKMERHLATLTEELDLTDEQATRIRAIFEEKHAEFQALRESAPEDHEARHEQFRALWEEARASMNEVLTDEQEARLEELHESRGHRGFKGGGFHGPHDPEEHLSRLTEALDLTDAQVAEIRAIFEEQRPKFEALHGDASEDREGRREAFMELREETHARVSAVLTEEQRARFEELKRSHEGHHGPRGGGHRGS